MAAAFFSVGLFVFFWPRLYQISWIGKEAGLAITGSLVLMALGFVCDIV